MPWRSTGCKDACRYRGRTECRRHFPPAPGPTARRGIPPPGRRREARARRCVVSSKLLCHCRAQAVKLGIILRGAIDVMVRPHDGGGALITVEPAGEGLSPDDAQAAAAVLGKQRAVRWMRRGREAAALERRNQVLPRHGGDPAAGLGKQAPVARTRRLGIALADDLADLLDHLDQPPDVLASFRFVGIEEALARLAAEDV